MSIGQNVEARLARVRKYTHPSKGSKINLDYAREKVMLIRVSDNSYQYQ